MNEIKYFIPGKLYATKTNIVFKQSISIPKNEIIMFLHHHRTLVYFLYKNLTIFEDLYDEEHYKYSLFEEING